PAREFKSSRSSMVQTVQGFGSVLSVQSVVKEEQPEDIHPSHLSYLYDSWLKWGGRKKGSAR
ncbi:MAG: hypothetical protein SO411_08855, partial [Bacteroidaceae bacterium]|nr:hypothetical protein [Bacteroidaceae bacterium]